MSSAFKQQHALPLLWIVWFCLCGQAQQPGVDCEPYLRFQVEVTPEFRGRDRILRSTAVQGMIGTEALSVVSVLPFDLSSRANNTLSLLLIVLDGGLQKKAVEKFAASLRKEERLHLRLAVVTRSGDQSAWSDDAVEQRRLLEGAATVASAWPADRPGTVPKSSDERVLERRWEEKLRLSVEDTIAQAGKLVILELLPPPPLLPVEGAEHWRIPRDRDYAGESQVHTFAALGVVPVYRVHNATPAGHGDSWWRCFV